MLNCAQLGNEIYPTKFWCKTVSQQKQKKCQKDLIIHDDREGNILHNFLHSKTTSTCEDLLSALQMLSPFFVDCHSGKRFQPLPPFLSQVKNIFILFSIFEFYICLTVFFIFGRKTVWETERQRDRETERQRDRETERQRDRETERQRDR
jgi:hypothetical protein